MWAKLMALWTTSAALALFTASIASADEFTIVDLGSLGGVESAAWQVNDSGTVVGSSETGVGQLQEGFIWKHGHMRRLGTLGGNYSFAFAINELEQAVGRSEVIPGSGVERAFMWDNGLLVDLGTFGGPYSGATDINDGGQIVGWAENKLGHQLAFIHEAGQMIHIGTLGGDESTAFSINANGTVAGDSFTIPGDESPSTERAFVWSQESGIQDLGTLAGGQTAAYDVNSVRQIVGTSHTSTGSHAFLWQNSVMTDLGTLGRRSFFSTSVALAVNDLGRIVGWSRASSTSKSQAVMVVDGKMLELTKLIPSGSGWESLESASDINNVGQIVGIGKRKGYMRAFLLTPEEVDCNQNGIVDEQEITQGLSADSNRNQVPDECDECLSAHNCDHDHVCIAGECVHISELCPDDDGNGMVTICHYPPGNPKHPHTITVSVSAIAAHFAHGDTCGPCN
jgi:probable HAF family extracellular repeat protein